MLDFRARAYLENNFYAWWGAGHRYFGWQSRRCSKSNDLRECRETARLYSPAIGPVLCCVTMGREQTEPSLPRGKQRHNKPSWKKVGWGSVKPQRQRYTSFHR